MRPKVGTPFFSSVRGTAPDWTARCVLKSGRLFQALPTRDWSEPRLKKRNKKKKKKKKKQKRRARFSVGDALVEGADPVGVLRAQFDDRFGVVEISGDRYVAPVRSVRHRRTLTSETNKQTNKQTTIFVRSFKSPSTESHIDLR